MKQTRSDPGSELRPETNVERAKRCIQSAVAAIRSVWRHRKWAADYVRSAKASLRKQKTRRFCATYG